MRMHHLVAPCLIPLLLAAGPSTTHASKEAPTTVREGRVFRVTCHFENASAASEALAVVEAVWEPARVLYGLRRRPEERLDVHLYRTPDDYVAAEAELTQGRFARNLAFAHWDSRSAHVAMQPPLADDALAEIGLPWQTRALLGTKPRTSSASISVPGSGRIPSGSRTERRSTSGTARWHA